MSAVPSHHSQQTPALTQQAFLMCWWSTTALSTMGQSLGSPGDRSQHMPSLKPH